MDKVEKHRFQVIEDNAGGLHLAVFDEEGNCEYFHSGYEQEQGHLKNDVFAISNGKYSVKEWCGNSEHPQEDYNNLISYEHCFEVVADNDGFYPERVGISAKKEFLVDKV